VGIGGWEVLVILFVVLLVFGPKRIPEVARGLGKGMRELRRISTDFQREINLSDIDEPAESRRKEITPPGSPDVSPRPKEEAVARENPPAPRGSPQAPEGRE
jgi:TatA/E family protein of Tat protein translocase